MRASLEIVTVAAAEPAISTALIAAGAAVLVAAVNVWQQRKQLGEQQKQLAQQVAAQRQQLEQQLAVAREGQQTERFTRAVEQLGDDQPAVRLGGIYALGKIAEASEQDRRPIYEVLAAFVHLHAPWPPRNSGPHPAEDHDRRTLPELRAWAPDVQAAMTVLAWRPYEPADESDPHDRLRLVGVDLRRVLLRHAKLQRANFREACLYRAVLADAHLEGASFIDARLEGVDLQRARLQGADLRRAKVENANFSGSDCSGANLGGVDLRGSTLTDVSFNGAIESSQTMWPGETPHGVIRQED